MMDEKSFVDEKFKKGIYSAIKSFDPEFILKTGSYHEKALTHVVNGIETEGAEKIDSDIEFKKGDFSLILEKEFTEEPFDLQLTMFHKHGEEESKVVFEIDINGDGSIVMESDLGCIFFPRMSIKGYFFSNKTLEDYERLTGTRFDVYDIPKKSVRPDDVIIPKGLGLSKKLEAIFEYFRPEYEKINASNQK